METFAVISAIACAVIFLKRMISASEKPVSDNGHWVSPSYQARRKRAIRNEFAAYAALSEGIK